MKHAAARELLNLKRLDEAMEAHGLDAIVARAGLNFTYLAGFAYPGTLARHVDLADSPRSPNDRHTTVMLKPRCAYRAMAPPARQTKSAEWALTIRPF